MRWRKLLPLSVAMLFAVTLIASACAQPAPTPEPAPTPAPAPDITSAQADTVTGPSDSGTEQSNQEESTDKKQ